MTTGSIITLIVISILIITAIVAWNLTKLFSKKEEISVLNNRLDIKYQDIKNLEKRLSLLENPPLLTYKDRVKVSEPSSKYHNKSGTVLQVTSSVGTMTTDPGKWMVDHVYVVDLDDINVKKVISVHEIYLKSYPHYGTKET